MESLRVHACHSFWVSSTWTLLPMFKGCFHCRRPATLSLPCSCGAGPCLRAARQRGLLQTPKVLSQGGRVAKDRVLGHWWWRGWQCEWWHVTSGARRVSSRPGTGGALRFQSRLPLRAAQARPLGPSGKPLAQGVTHSRHSVSPRRAPREYRANGGRRRGSRGTGA